MTDIVKRTLQEQPKGKTDYVFESRNGGKMTQVSRAYYRAVKKAGLNHGPDGKEMTSRKHRINFHSLRHTYASWLAIAGVPLYTIKELMGHKSIEMTMRYAHLCPDHKREAAARISGQWCAASSDQEKPRYPEGDTGSDGQA
jgi:integrase